MTDYTLYRWTAQITRITVCVCALHYITFHVRHYILRDGPRCLYTVRCYVTFLYKLCFAIVLLHATMQQYLQSHNEKSHRNCCSSGSSNCSIITNNIIVWYWFMHHKIIGTLNVDSIEYYFNLIRGKKYVHNGSESVCACTCTCIAVVVQLLRLVLRNKHRHTLNPCVQFHAL